MHVLIGIATPCSRDCFRSKATICPWTLSIFFLMQFTQRRIILVRARGLWPFRGVQVAAPDKARLSRGGLYRTVVNSAWHEKPLSFLCFLNFVPITLVTLPVNGHTEFSCKVSAHLYPTNEWCTSINLSLFTLCKVSR